ncbi:MAG: response regulator [Nitrospinae bacterium]|nr:response regulator [Nitrospinota bacterium]
MEYAGKTALVVDDYNSMRVAMKDLLVRKGFTVIEAGDGLQGLELLKETPEKYDIIFSDIVMPVMDGFELCQEVKSHPSLYRIPVVVLSTHTDASYLLKAINMGADDYVAKPIEPALLDKVIARLMVSYE